MPSSSIPKRAAALVLALLSLAGCSSDPEPAEAPAATANATTAALPPEELYVQTVRQSSYVDDVTDETLLMAGEETCGALDRGVEPLEVLALATETDLEAGSVIFGTAVGILCREHLEAAQELAEQLGG
ncbi:DUF732 domain-containing protein [uncultured Cellulomonas sp.]|uniref:DUF732 domain-containing protein n=1 Tax=uncultured Cellulomonas sp. TaxID=189682 RepID=UPI002639AA58|nr:DUF732 domain-containing protein [uncultured Cellulomonas sp.]